jgi:hypothetical protein
MISVAEIKMVKRAIQFANCDICTKGVYKRRNEGREEDGGSESMAL